MTSTDDAIGLAHALRRETDGNPFFTGEMLRHLGESGAIVLGADGRWTVVGELAELGLPSSIRDVVGRRVERLGDEAFARVVTRGGDRPRVRHRHPRRARRPRRGPAARSHGRGGRGRGADRERRRRPVSVRARPHATHPLRRAQPTRRQRAHQRIAERLEADAVVEDATTLAELAHHWVAATRPADLGKALGYVRRAGDAARDALAPDDAIRWYQQALDLIDRQATPDEHQRAELLAALGTVQRQAGRPEFRDTLLRAAALAEQLDDTDVLVRVALGFTEHDTFGDSDIKRAATAALGRIGPEPTPVRARLLSALANSYDSASEGGRAPGSRAPGG
jgi:hypothetical protein